MSFQSSNKSGEVEVLSPYDFLQFTGLRGAGELVGSGFSQVFKLFPTAFKTEAEIIAERATAQGQILFREPAAFGKKWYDDIVKALTSKPAKVAAPAIGGGSLGASIRTVLSPSLSTKALIGGGLLTTSIVTLSTTPGGRELTSLGKDTVGIVSNTTDFLKKNPLIVVGGIALVGIMLISSKGK